MKRIYKTRVAWTRVEVWQAADGTFTVVVGRETKHGLDHINACAALGGAILTLRGVESPFLKPYTSENPTDA